MEIAVLPSGTTRIFAPRSAVTTQKHPTNGRNASGASWNRISARWTRELLMLILAKVPAPSSKKQSITEHGDRSRLSSGRLPIVLRFRPSDRHSRRCDHALSHIEHSGQLYRIAI